MKKSQKAWKKWLWPIEKLVILVVIIVVIFTFQFTAHMCVGGAMYPYIQDSTLVLYDRHGKVVRHTVISYKHGDSSFVSRVIAIPGDRVSVDHGKCFLNGVEQESFYRVLGDVSEHTVQAGHYFVLNDYRSNLNDSRKYGDIAEKDIEGTYFMSVHTGSI